jgi:hypothetical protein
MTDRQESFSIPAPVVKALAKTLHCLNQASEDGLDHETGFDFVGYFCDNAIDVLKSVPESVQNVWNLEFAADD